MERNQNDAIKVETVEPKIKEQNQFNSTNRLTIQIEQAKREPEFNSNSHNSVNSGVLHGSATPSGLTERAKE